MNFAWSLKPIFIWFTILFGTDLDRSEAKSKFRRCLSIIICLFWLLCFSIPFSAYSLYLGVTKNRYPTSFYKQTNWQIDLFGYGTLITLFHVSILFAAFVKWRPLWEKLQRIQDAIGEDRQFYRQIRRDATMGLILLLMVTLRSYFEGFNDIKKLNFVKKKKKNNEAMKILNSYLISK